MSEFSTLVNEANAKKQHIAMKRGGPKMQSSKIGGSQFGATYV